LKCRLESLNLLLNAHDTDVVNVECDGADEVAFASSEPETGILRRLLEAHGAQNFAQVKIKLPGRLYQTVEGFVETYQGCAVVVGQMLADEVLLRQT
jgi:hypothetical protein